MAFEADQRNKAAIEAAAKAEDDEIEANAKAASDASLGLTKTSLAKALIKAPTG